MMQFFFWEEGGDISVKCLILFWDWPPCGFPVTPDLTPNTPEASVGSSRPVPVLEKGLEPSLPAPSSGFQDLCSFFAR